MTMGKHNIARVALNTSGLQIFVKNNLSSRGFESPKQAVRFRKRIMLYLRQCGMKGGALYADYTKCHARIPSNPPCDIGGCPWCDMLKRALLAYRLAPYFLKLARQGYTLYLVTIILPDAQFTDSELKALNWKTWRTMIYAKLRKAFPNDDVRGFIAPDVDKDSFWRLHLHGVLAMKGIRFRVITEKLREQFNPDFVDSSKPVLKKAIRLCDLPYVITYTYRSKGSIASKVRKRRGVDLKKREGVFRTFLSKMTFGERVIRFRM